MIEGAAAREMARALDDSSSKARNPVRRETIVRVTMMGIIGAIIVVYFVVKIFDVPLEADNYTNGFSTSPAGHSALIELLRENGRTVRLGHSELQLPDYAGARTDTLALLQPGPRFVGHFEETFSQLFVRARESETSVLLVLPKRTYEEAPDQPPDGDVVLWEDSHSLGEVRTILQRTGFDQWLAVERLSGARRKLVWSDGNSEAALEGPTQVFRLVKADLPSGFTVLASADTGEPIVVRHRAKGAVGGVILVSDPDIFTNRFIHTPGAATLALRVFQETPQSGTIIVDEDLHGFSSDASLEYLAATPPGLWVSLSAVLLLLIFGWRQATVLRPRTSEPQERRARKFSIEGLARMMERAGDHDTAYRRILRRARLVLGTGGAQVQGAGKQGTQAIKKGKTGRITRIEGATTEERLVNAAARVAQQKRTGESASEDWQ